MKTDFLEGIVNFCVNALTTFIHIFINPWVLVVLAILGIAVWFFFLRQRV